MRSIKFQSQENRNREAARYKAQGYTVRKRSIRGQSLSPDYVADFTGKATPNGFGGAAPQYFPVLYVIELS